ncbi:MAG: hypothetical protein N2321_03035 [Melioribacteraceae bacterium]|nr:hypothetical protein [Melioribacteraceae bacterium]
MKIAVATNDYSTVTGHIGRCKGFIIYDIENENIINKIELENNLTNHSHSHHNNHEHGHSHKNLINALKDCSHLICQSAGWRIIEDLKQNNIDVVFTNEINADLAAIKFCKGELIINESATCHSHH